MTKELSPFMMAKDNGAEDFFETTIKQINQYWEQSESMSLDEYKLYKNV